MPWDAIRFASSAVRESVTTSTRAGAGRPFADRQRAVLLWPPSAHVTAGGSFTPAACGGVREGVGMARGWSGTAVAIRVPIPESEGRIGD